MSEPAKAAVLALVAFLLANLAASAASLVLARPWLHEREGRPARRRARALFALCVLPTAAALVVLAVFLVPAYLAHEPAGAGEVLGARARVLAALGAALLLASLRRGLRTRRETRALEAAWAAAARPLSLPAAGLPAFEMPNRYPIVSVLGIRRPRLYAARQVLAALSPDEQDAVLGHERAHVAARDNLRLWLVRACPDALGTLPARRRLVRAWLEATEDAADEAAARRGPGAALALAEALIKVARLVPPDVHVPMHALALHNGDDLARRVRRLLGALPDSAEPPRRRRLAAGLVVAAALAPAYPGTLRVVHVITERLVAFLA